MKKLFILILFAISCNTHSKPQFQGLVSPTNPTNEIQVGDSSVKKIKKNYYTLVYDLNLKSPLYTYYTLLGENLKHLDNKRTTFHFDNDVPYNLQSGPADYKGSGYDKGHLAPDDDFRFNFEAESEAMVYTNCAPQVSSFNRGIWKSIEDYTRMNAENYDSVKIYTGVIYSDNSIRLKSIFIPDYFFKIEIFNNQMVCFLGANQTQNTKNIFDLKVPLDSIKVKLNSNYSNILALTEK